MSKPLRLPSFLSLVLAASLLGTLSVPARAQDALPKGFTRVTAVEGITEYRLTNGLRVLLFPDQSKQTITVNITYLVGSRHENYGETGMAHLLEHLVFKGTPKHQNIPQELTERGARPNGTTWFDRTNYYETFNATDANLEWALDLEADRMVNSFIAKKDLDSEMTVVRNELEMGENSPFRVSYKRILGAAYDWHNYSKDTIGARSDVENVPIDRLQAFYRKYYQPDNAVLLVAGKFDPSKTLRLIDAKFSAIPKPERVLQHIYTVEPTQDGERSVAIRRVGETQMVLAGYHIPAGAHPDYAPLDILAKILGDTPTGRLHKALVETKKAASIEDLSLQLHDPGMMMYLAEVRKEDSIEAARDALLKTVEECASQPPTTEEIERARRSLLSRFELTLNQADRVGLTLSEWIGMGDWRLFFLHRDRIKKASAADVKRVAETYLKPSNRTVVSFIPTAKPDRAEITPAPDVASLLKDYKGEAAVAEGEAFDPAPANIESRTKRPDVGGLKLAMLPKKTRGGTVSVMLNLRFGNEKSLANRSTPAQMAGQMLMRGTTQHTREQIKEELDRMNARAFVFGSTTGAGASIEIRRENLIPALKLVAEVLRKPAFPESEFETLKKEMLANFESQRTEPNAAAFLAFNRHMNPYPKGDPRYVSTLDEQIERIKAVTLEEVKTFYTDFYGASIGEMAVVGDFDPAEIEKLTAELFGDWKSPGQYERLASTYRDIPAVNRAIETPDKPNAFFLAGMKLNLRDDDPDYPALVLGNYMLGGGFLNSRLATRIRQKEGLSYGVGSQLFAGSIDRDGQFMAFALYAPQNAAKLETAFKEELQRALEQGFTAEEVAAAKSGYLQSQQVSRAQDSGLSRKLSSYRFLKRTLAWDADFDEKVSALTAEQINSAMKKHLSLAKVSIFKAGDFAKAAQQPPSQQ
jgi:zinc protease